ncbi:MAG: SRPBCC family protein [Parvibaculum sp.]|uniref:SRPBCC family protein n=1 Tax=Parvibaculum sp. TaxID=2024848 RepID=UPI00283BB61A|nr:SRPBCC family protein [Parvibaculum sp.]MDR3500842.1 SRPBCC family protein [Parvibaculum sp.]
MTEKAVSTFIYVTYIRTTPAKLWMALTDVEFMKRYWFGTYCESEWKRGASWRMVQPGGQVSDVGEILEAEPEKRLVIKWRNEFRPELKVEGESLCTMDIEPIQGAVKLTVTHTINREKSKFIEAVSGGWPRILSNLKSLIESGEIVLATKP